MPGIINKKKEAGITFPPDWREIGYSDTPESTLEGFDYAKEIDANWDTSQHTYMEAFKDDYKLMYFPNMSYEKRYSMERCDRMFQNSNLEYFNCGLPFIQQISSMFASCHNLRYCKITDLENTGINTINGLFTDCFQLERVDVNFDTLPSSVTQMTNLFSACWNLKEISINNPNIERADGAFQNTYKLNKANIKLPKCYNSSFYASGKNTTNGLSIDIVIGTNATQDVSCTFENAKIAGDYDAENVSSIVIVNCGSLQSCFRGSTLIKCEDSNIGPNIQAFCRNNNPINCSFAFMNAISEGCVIGPQIEKVGNGISLFNGLTFNNGNAKINVQDIDFSTATRLDNAFANSNVVTIEHIDQADFSTCTIFENMFQNTSTLDNNTVNGILKALTTASSYTGIKTLAYLGFTAADYPAATIQSLSNYSDFITAGWIIGY